MTIKEMKQRKQELGYTYAQLSEKSGVPLGTIQKIFSGETESPRYDTLIALEQALRPVWAVMEPSFYSVTPQKRQGQYTIEDYYALPDEQRVELIDGCFYDMSAPTTLHQVIAGEIHRQISNFILEREGDCIPMISPVDVQLDCDEKTMVQPDVLIVCQRDKVINRCVYGAPDFVLEVISPSTRRKDYTKKLAKYIEAGVREYWILDPYQNKLLIYDFESNTYPQIMGLEGEVPVGIYHGELLIQMKYVRKWIDEWNITEEGAP